MSIKLIVILVFILIFLYRVVLDVIDLRTAGKKVPDNVKDIYDEEAFLKWSSYHKEKTRHSMISYTFSFLVDLALLIFNLYAAFASLFPSGLFIQMFAVVLLSALTGFLAIPFSYYDTMVIEQKYGFNRSTKATFWADQIKEFVISLILIVGISSLLLWTHQALGDWLIVVFAAIMTLFVLAIAFLFPFLSRIFNKFTPLEDGELKEKVTALLEKHGYKVRAIQVMDASRRTSKSNAYFSGFGKMKTIVLYDTLIQTMTPDEICAVFAHEMGHGLHKDTLRNQILSFIQMSLLAVLSWLTLRSPELFTAFGFTGVNYGFAVLIIMSVEFACIAPLFGLVVNYFSRRAEYRADEVAVREGYGSELISGLKKLTRQNYGDVAPSPILVKLQYSHPTLSQRIDAIEKIQSTQGE